MRREKARSVAGLQNPSSSSFTLADKLPDITTSPCAIPTSMISCFTSWRLLFTAGLCFRIFADACNEWKILLNNTGVSAMHMQLLYTDHVLIYDRTDFGNSNISLPDGVCINNPNYTVWRNDCTAHSVEYDVAANSIRPLLLLSDVWCSSGSVMANGSLVQTGGYNLGERVARIFRPSSNWEDVPDALAVRRWYSTNHILPGDRQIIIGGRRSFNYEFYPKTDAASKAYSLPFLVQTDDPDQENNLYPYVFLHTDGNLFIFANNRAILFNYTGNAIVKTFPTIPGGEPRNYPSTGSAVMLPLDLRGAFAEVEVVVCGGAPNGSFVQVSKNNTFVGALNTCARIKITDPSPEWVMETMPLARVMGDMLLLPDGNVLIINGAAQGTAGWEYARCPVLNPVLYEPHKPIGSRFKVMSASTIPRLYHSTAILLRDGRVLVGGSNPHNFYEFFQETFPTELRLEAFSPDYLHYSFDKVRPYILSPASLTEIQYGQNLTVSFSTGRRPNPNSIKVTMLAPPFNTHSFSMNQRLLVLESGNFTNQGDMTFSIEVTAPAAPVLAPAGYYILFVVHLGIPSEGIWVQIDEV